MSVIAEPPGVDGASLADLPEDGGARLWKLARVLRRSWRVHDIPKRMTLKTKNFYWPSRGRSLFDRQKLPAHATGFAERSVKCR